MAINFHAVSSYLLSDITLASFESHCPTLLGFPKLEAQAPLYGWLKLQLLEF